MRAPGKAYHRNRLAKRPAGLAEPKLVAPRRKPGTLTAANSLSTGQPVSFTGQATTIHHHDGATSTLPIATEEVSLAIFVTRAGKHETKLAATFPANRTSRKGKALQQALKAAGFYAQWNPTQTGVSVHRQKPGVGDWHAAAQIVRAYGGTVNN